MKLAGVGNGELKRNLQTEKHSHLHFNEIEAHFFSLLSFGLGKYFQEICDFCFFFALKGITSDMHN